MSLRRAALTQHIDKIFSINIVCTYVFTYKHMFFMKCLRFSQCAPLLK